MMTKTSFSDDDFLSNFNSYDDDCEHDDVMNADDYDRRRYERDGWNESRYDRQYW